MYYSHYENYFSTFCPNSNTLICKLDTVYRYTVFNGKPVYGSYIAGLGRDQLEHLASPMTKSETIEKRLESGLEYYSPNM